MAGLSQWGFLRCQMDMETSSVLSFTVGPEVKHLCCVLYTKLKSKFTGASAQRNPEWQVLGRWWHTEMGVVRDTSGALLVEGSSSSRGNGAVSTGLRMGMRREGPSPGGMASMKAKGQESRRCMARRPQEKGQSGAWEANHEVILESRPEGEA